MERIKNVMQRLQELYYSKHQKTSIDIDLMLDYTRVMYADLLEWRKDVKEEPQTNEAAEKNEEVVTSQPAQITEQTEEPEPVPEAKSEPVEPEPIPEAEEEPVEPEPESKEEELVDASNEQDETATPEPEAVEIPKAHEVQPFQPIERDEPAPQEPMMPDNEEPVISETPEAEPMEALQGNLIGISFEPPAPIEKRHEIEDELLIEEPAVNETVEEIPVPVPQEIPLPEMKPFEPIELNVHPQVQQFSVPAQRKDIRKAIGINDKYLFLNELFNHHKSNYEETLDELNKMDTYEQAADWINSTAAKENKWDRDDATAHSFYAMLSKHFSER